MPKKEEPRSGCPVGVALDIVGDRWSLLVVRDMLIWNEHEFANFRDAGEGIATNILTDRLKTLASAGLIDSIPHPSNKTKKLYFLTERGKALAPVLVELILWGADCEGSQAPPEKVAEVREDREGFITGLMEKIAEWEAEYLK